MVLVAREDGERMARLLASGHPVWADSASQPDRRAHQISNVIGEIKGSEKPDEFVILGAHLDSWELGTGALDNGCNAALVIDALRAIKASGLKPRRTIRFILFSGEEEGLLGSRAYARAHRFELDKPPESSSTIREQARPRAFPMAAARMWSIPPSASSRRCSNSA